MKSPTEISSDIIEEFFADLKYNNFFRTFQESARLLEVFYFGSILI